MPDENGKATSAMAPNHTAAKSYNKSYERKTAAVFSMGEIERFLQFQTNEPYWLVRKAIVTLAICGGLRCAELRELDVDSVKWKDYQNAVTFDDSQNPFTKIQ